MFHLQCPVFKQILSGTQKQDQEKKQTTETNLQGTQMSELI